MSLSSLIGRVKKAPAVCGGKVFGAGKFVVKQLASRANRVNFAGQMFFFNPFVAGGEMWRKYMTQPDLSVASVATGRCVGSAQSLLGITLLYALGRDKLVRRLGLLNPTTLKKHAALFAADTVYAFGFNAPVLALNYLIGGMAVEDIPSNAFYMSLKLCLTGPIAGVLLNTFKAMDSDDPKIKAKVLKPIRWALIDRFELATRKKMIWACLAASTAATAAIYTFAPGGFLNH